jgi:hypothetical protein
MAPATSTGPGEARSGRWCLSNAVPPATTTMQSSAAGNDRVSPFVGVSRFPAFPAADVCRPRP